MVSLSCKDLGKDCEFVAEGDSPRKVKNKIFEHMRDEHPEMIAGMTDEQRRELERAMDAAVRESATA